MFSPQVLSLRMLSYLQLPSSADLMDKSASTKELAITVKNKVHSLVHFAGDMYLVYCTLKASFHEHPPLVVNTLL